MGRAPVIRRLAGAPAIAAALWFGAFVAHATPADRGAIAYTQFDQIRATPDVSGPPRDPFSVPAIATGEAPVWSPDGTRLAYFTGTFGGPYSGVTVTNADGSGAQQVLSVDGNGFLKAASGLIVTNFDLNGVSDRQRLTGLSWSADGRAVRYVVVTSAVTTGLLRTELDGGPTRALGTIRHPAGGIPRQVAWAPRGPLIAFSAPGVARDGSACAPGRLRVLTARVRLPGLGQTGREVAPTATPCGDARVAQVHPAFSPDGTRIVFGRERPGARAGSPIRDLRVVDIGPGGAPLEPARALAPNVRGAYWPTFSPDGVRIAYLFSRRSDGVSGLGVMNANGSGGHPLVAGKALVLQSPVWRYAPR